MNFLQAMCANGDRLQQVVCLVAAGKPNPDCDLVSAASGIPHFSRAPAIL